MSLLTHCGSESLSPERARQSACFLQQGGSWACLNCWIPVLGWLRAHCPSVKPACFLLITVHEARRNILLFEFLRFRFRDQCFTTPKPHSQQVSLMFLEPFNKTMNWTQGPRPRCVHIWTLVARWFHSLPPCKHEKTRPFLLGNISEQVILIFIFCFFRVCDGVSDFWCGEWIKSRAQRLWLVFCPERKNSQKASAPDSRPKAGVCSTFGTKA